MDKTNDRKLIVRYTASQRINHWLIAISFILLVISGLALFHPAFYWMSHLLGGGVWTRILHPFIGVFMFVLFVIFAARMFSNNRIQRHDIEWMKGYRDVINDREDRLPEQGRYNGGQKFIFFSMIILMLALLITGIVIWRVFFGAVFPVSVIRLGSLLHAFFAFLMIVALIVHIYAGIWVKGSVRAMTRGTVTPGWAWKHHRAWYRQLLGQNSAGTPRQPRRPVEGR